SPASWNSASQDEKLLRKTLNCTRNTSRPRSCPAGCSDGTSCCNLSTPACHKRIAPKPLPRTHAMFDLAAIQSPLQQLHADDWLLYDFRGLNLLARRVVQLPPDKFLSRRWFYFVPARGEPRKLVHRIERHALA